jgi:hypothetical protein
MNKSVLQDWVCELPVMMQALLCCALRGPDTNEKESPAKCLLRLMRGAVLKPADPKYKGNSDSFMWTDYREDLLSGSLAAKAACVKLTVFQSNMEDFLESHDHYPHHFIMHLVHAAEVIGHFHPDITIAGAWQTFYMRMCDSFHMRCETKSQLEKRLQ